MNNVFDIAQDALFGDPVGSRINPNKSRLLDAFEAVQNEIIGLQNPPVHSIIQSIINGLGPNPYNFESLVKDENAQLGYVLTREGPGSGNVTQSGVEIGPAERIYTLHVFNASDEEAYITAHIKGLRNQGPMRRSKTANQEVGHQGLSREKSEGVKITFWSSANDSIIDAENHVVRFDVEDDPSDAENLLISNVQIFKVWPGNDGNGNTTPFVSKDGKFLFVEQADNVNGMVRVFRISDLVDGGPGDYSVDTHILEVPFDTVHNTDRRVQDLTFDGQYLYVLASASAAPDAALAQIDLAGNAKILPLDVGKTLSESDGAGTFYEPESIFFANVDGVERMALLVASGDPGARVTRVFYLDTPPIQNESWVDDLYLSDDDTSGNTGVETYPTLFTRNGKAVTFTFSENNVDTTGLTGSQNFYLRGFSQMPANNTAFVFSTSQFNYDDDTVQAAAVLSPTTGAMRVQESKDSAGSGTSNVGHIATGVTDLLVSGTYIIE